MSEFDRVKSWHHWKDGWGFQRRDDGSVVIAKFADAMLSGPPNGEAVIPPAEWASIIASVSRRGENAEQFTAAVQFHNDSWPMGEK